MTTRSRTTELQAMAAKGDRHARSKLHMAARTNRRQLERLADQGSPTACRELAALLRTEGNRALAAVYEKKAIERRAGR